MGFIEMIDFALNIVETVVDSLIIVCMVKMLKNRKDESNEQKSYRKERRNIDIGDKWNEWSLKLSSKIGE